MIEYLGEFLVRFSIISLGLYFLRSVRKGLFGMALTSASKQSSSSSSTPLSPRMGSLFLEKGASYCKQFGGNINIHHPKRQKINISSNYFKIDRDHHQSSHSGQLLLLGNHQQSLLLHHHHQDQQEIINIINPVEENPSTAANQSSSPPPGTAGILIKQSMLRKRPAQLVVPVFCPAMDFGEVGKKWDRREFQAEGKGFALASKKGKRELMEDGHGVMLDISGNPKQAFFVVIDGHGGRAAADFVGENLGRNIMNEIKVGGNYVGKHEIEAAVRRGYSVTDDQFLNQKVEGGACAASVLVKDGELHVANVGDCKVILSRKGVANALTTDHRLTREDERARIQNSGGFLDCRNGVWRVNGSLAVSRAFGDLYLKDHVISEPDTLQLPLTSDCDFLIMASDGLWDKVGEQEAVDVVVVLSTEKDSLECCKELVAMSSSRGGADDVTVMLINLQNFVN